MQGGLRLGLELVRLPKGVGQTELGSAGPASPRGEGSTRHRVGTEQSSGSSGPGPKDARRRSFSEATSMAQSCPQS